MGEKKEKKSKKKDKEAEEAPPPAEEAAPAAAAEEAPKPAAKKPTGNVFALFNQAQIQEFKEAFTMIDQNRDGFIDENDLSAMFQQTGREAEPKQLKEMMAEAPGTLNFTNFLALFGEKLGGTDPERALMDAFKMFDDEGKGVLGEAYFKDMLMEVGDIFTKDEIKQTWKEVPVEGGNIDYTKFVHIIKRGNQEGGE